MRHTRHPEWGVGVVSDKPVEWDQVFEVNVRGTYFLTQAVGGRMLDAEGGSVVTVTSLAGEVVTRAAVSYQASKAALIQTTRALAVHWAPKVRVNAVCPVMGVTGLTSAFMGTEDTPENRARFVATIPLGRLSTPEDIANACLWLAEDSSSFITGVLLPVDGGRCA